MDIYREESNIAYKSFLSSSTNINTERVRTYSSLPLFTISESLLRKILKRNKVPVPDQAKIISY